MLIRNLEQKYQRYQYNILTIIYLFHIILKTIIYIRRETEDYIQMKKDTVYKVILVGNTRVGKTSYLHAITGRNSVGKGQVPPTIGVEYAPMTIKLPNYGKTVQVNIWDTSGAQKYRSITSSYYRKAQGIILMFDITDAKTFKDLKNWLNQIFQKTGRKLHIVIVGNKIDLVGSGQKQRQVTQKQIIDFCVENSLTYHLTSTITGVNIKQSFTELIQKIYDGQINNINADNHQSHSDYTIVNTSILVDKQKPIREETSQCSKCC